MKSKFSINGEDFEGDELEIKKNGVVLIDDIEQDLEISGVVEVVVLHTGDKPLRVCTGSKMDVHGDVKGSASAGTNLQCGNIGGSAQAGSSIKCSNIHGSAKAGGSIHCAEIKGSASAGGVITFSK